MILDNGNCAIDIKVNTDGAQKDVSNFLQLTNAADAILRDCVSIPQPNTGGVVNQLGVFKDLLLHPVNPPAEVHLVPCPARSSSHSYIDLLNSGVKYRSLSVEMSRYSPNVECHRILSAPPPSYNSCKQLLDTMQWSNTMVEFGLPWQVRLSGSIIICGCHIGESLGMLVLKFSSSLKPRFTYLTYFIQVGSALEET